MKALADFNEVSFKSHDNLQDYLNESSLNCKLFDFISSMEQRYEVSLQALDLFNKAYELCRKAIITPYASVELNKSRLGKTGNNKLELLPYIMAWFILSSYKQLPFTVETFVNRLHDLFKRSTLYSLAKEQINLKDVRYLIKMDNSGNNNTGNSFQQFNIQHVENLNPNATTVINNYYI